MMNCKIPCNSTALLPHTTPLKFAFNQTAIPHIRTKRTLTGYIVAVSLQLSSLLLHPSNNTPFNFSPYFCNIELLYGQSSQ